MPRVTCSRPPTLLGAGLIVLILFGVTVTPAQTVLTLDTSSTGDITAPLAHYEGTEPVAASLSSVGGELKFTHTGSTPTGSTDIVTQWAVGTGTTPLDLSGLVGPMWQVTWNAGHDGGHVTDRMNIYLDTDHHGSSLEDYALGFQTSAGSGTAAAQGLKLVVNGAKTVVNDAGGTVPLNGTVSRSYRLRVDESADTYNAFVDDGGGFYEVGAGSLPAPLTGSSQREVYISIRERQPQDGLTTVGTLSSLAVENVAAETNQPHIVSFSADPTSITNGGSSLLSWTVSNVTGAAIAPGVGDVTGLTSNNQGSIGVSPATTTTYTLIATNASGSVDAQALVTVAPSVSSRPNHLFIAIDDLKPVCGFMSENPGNLLNMIYTNPEGRHHPPAASQGQRLHHRRHGQDLSHGRRRGGRPGVLLDHLVRQCAIHREPGYPLEIGLVTLRRRHVRRAVARQLDRPGERRCHRLQGGAPPLPGLCGPRGSLRATAPGCAGRQSVGRQHRRRVVE